MKKTKILILILICICGCLLAGCEKIKNDMGITDTQSATTYSVTFESDGKRFHGAFAKGGGVVAKPTKEPTKTNHRFIGWSTAEDEYVPYNFKSPVTSSFSLYAYFELDTELLKNGIEQVRKSAVKIENKSYNSDSDCVIKEGVGFVFFKNDKYCYTVTSYEAMKRAEGYEDQKITVTDIDGNTYKGYYYRRNESAPVASDSKYGLTVVCFEYKGSELPVISREDACPDIGDYVLAVGAENQSDSYGKVLDIKKAELEGTDIGFGVIHHNAVLEEQKQSLLFNMNFTLAGLTYATDEGVGYTVPSAKITEFLNKYVY